MQKKEPGTDHTVLLLIEIFDTVARVLVLTKTCLVFFGVEFGFIIPQLQFLDIHCKRRFWSDFWIRDQGVSACQRGAPTFIDSIGDLVKDTTIALLGDDLGAGEGGHCSEESSSSSGGGDLGWLRRWWLC